VADPRLLGGSRPSLRRGVQKKWDGTGGQDEQALGRSRGGFGTKVHVSCNPLGHPVEFKLTPAQASDIKQAEDLLAEHRPTAVIADAGYDSDALAETIARRGAEVVVKPNRCRKEPRVIDRHLYKERNLVERFWSKVKQYRRVATRYEKKAANFLAFVQVASVMVMLQ
jgi:transposase